jgi:hypothetical protein
LTTNAAQCGEGFRVTSTGTFRTNGAGGTVTYYWVRSGVAQPRQSMVVAKGDTGTKVITDTWTPNSSGTEQLVFVSPSYPTLTKSFNCGG